MEPNAEGNLLEIMDLARTLRQEQLYIQQEQAAFMQLTDTLAENSNTITKLAYICAQQRQNLNDLIISRPDVGPVACCRRANNFENLKFIDAKKVMDYEHAITYEELFNHLYRSPFLLAFSLATGDRIPEISQQHMAIVIHTLSTGVFGNAINTKDVEIMLKLLRELIEIQIVVSDNPRRLLRANSSAFARLYHRLNESMFSAKIFLTAALHDPIMNVLSDTEAILDFDPSKAMQRFSSKERLRRFGAENSNDYQQNIIKFHDETLTKLHTLAKLFIDNLTQNWSLFPSTLRWLVQTMCHHLKQSHFSDKIINEIITDMVFTHFICPAIVSPDIIGIIDAPISEQVRFNLMQIGQIIQTLALAKFEDVEAKYAEIYAKFEANMVTSLIDLLLVSQSGEDVVAILSQQSEFERSHLLVTQSELNYLVGFFRILMANEEFEVSNEDRQKLNKILTHLPEPADAMQLNAEARGAASCGDVSESHGKERSKQSFISLGKATKSKIAKSMSFSNNNGQNGTIVDGAVTSTSAANATAMNGIAMPNGNGIGQAGLGATSESQLASCSISNASSSSTNSSPIRTINIETIENEPVLVFNFHTGDDHKLQPLTEEEVLKMNSIGQEISNGEALLVDTGSCNLDNTLDKSSVANGFDAMDGMSDVLRPLHTKTTRFSLSHDDASIGNSDNLEAVSEAPSNHSVTSSLELEENDQNDNLSDMVSANVSGRGTPNISGRDTPSSLVTEGESVHNALPTPQMQKLISKARSDIEDKFCKFELKKFEGDETVSIISDTWSTDVLASDSETVDANDRERDRERNFSTPLIPSAVVLPGDNNFDALSNTRGGYLDASDQRSESNWSTDVLASDSEKLAEVDTDDNLSVTAKSDITDAGGRSEQERDRERDQLAAAISAPLEREREIRAVNETPYYLARRGRTSAAPGRIGVAGSDCGHGSGGSSGGNASDRSQEDTAFYDAVNMYDDMQSASVCVAGGSGGGTVAVSSAGDFAASRHHYHGVSSLARSSVRTTNQFAAESSFQQNYKSTSVSNTSSNINDGKESFLGMPRMRRQASAESSISNQSLNLEDAAVAGKPPKAHHKGALKKKKHNHANNHQKNTDSKDLIDFSDFGEEKPATDGEMLARTRETLVDIFTDESNVEHRRLSTEQRTVVFDGRRNGIMALKSETDGGAMSSSTPALRRHQSLNYENHEIMITNVISSKHASVVPSLNINDALSHPADGNCQKQQQQQEEILLCVKTEQLQLNDTDNGNGNDVFIDSAEPSTSARMVLDQPSTSAGIVGNGEGTGSSPTTSALTSNQKPTKATGAIPKSISFDASADKNSNAAATRSLSHRHWRINDGMRHVSGSGTANSSIFNKLKQGIFKTRRSHKSPRNMTNEEYSQQSSRSVSFSTNASEMSLDMLGGVGIGVGTVNISGIGGGNGATSRTGSTGYCDITEDILAKYRRKVSTSSDATNSDSIGHGVGLENPKNNLDIETNRLSNASVQHDKTMAFNLIKKKIRTVLSKTDLHTGDFRHNTHSNVSPLLTYLQIQLAQALNLQNFQQISYVSEAIRCITTLESGQHAQLLEELQTDIQKRQNYLQYLMRYRQNLLLILENVEQFEARLRGESNICNRYLMTMCVRLFLEKRQAKLEAFQTEFAGLTVSDDKVDLIEECIEELMNELLANGGILHGMPDWQAQEARISIERFLLQCMYQQVMFPNEDADLSRDSVLFEHIRKLRNIIRPSHPALCIPQEFLSEAPWTFAQQQLSYISAYKTPREKLQCVIRCISSIISLLHMSSGCIPAADDILPVLIYVVIMTNPPYLLSTVEYIQCFIGEKLDGEEQFHWTLFGSVVKFIKTMDYLD